MVVPELTPYICPKWANRVPNFAENSSIQVPESPCFAKFSINHGVTTTFCPEERIELL